MTRAVIFEEHSSVLAHWFGSGVRGATLVYLDAHLDLQFIDPERIARLAACVSAAQIAALESPHCLSPDRGFCYGIEDFLFAAARLGLVRRVVWVAPPHVIRGGMASALRGLLQMEGVTIGELETFRLLPNGALEGRLLGVELAICTLAQLAGLALEGPLALDIDTDYFVQVPADTVWTDPRAEIAALRCLPGAPADITIARSVGSGFLPLRHRFLADYLAALWEGREADAAYWQRLLQADGMAGDEALARYAGLAAERPGCAAAAHALALAASDAALLARAAECDPAYEDDIVRRLGGFRARRIRLNLAQVLALQRELEAAPDNAIAWIALGRLFTAFGRLDDARQCDEASRAAGGYPELALEIAKLHMAKGEVALAIPLLERAALDDETRVGAWLHLAECAHAGGDHARAIALATQARRAAPAWPAVIRRLAVFARANGDIATAGTLLREAGQLERRVSALAGMHDAPVFQRPESS